jgi:hypothetical protein
MRIGDDEFAEKFPPLSDLPGRVHIQEQGVTGVRAVGHYEGLYLYGVICQSKGLT